MPLFRAARLIGARCNLQSDKRLVPVASKPNRPTCIYQMRIAARAKEDAIPDFGGHCLSGTSPATSDFFIFPACLMVDLVKTYGCVCQLKLTFHDG